MRCERQVRSPTAARVPLTNRARHSGRRGELDDTVPARGVRNADAGRGGEERSESKTQR